MGEPANFGAWNPAMRGAFLKGSAHCLEGGSIDDCPYQDKRKPSGKLSWSRAFINAWRDGFQYAQHDREGAKIMMLYAPSYNRYRQLTK